MRLLDQLEGRERELVRRRSQPEFSTPMLATLTHEVFSDPAWVFERKFDGERALGFHQGDRTRLLSRKGQRLDGSYPEIVSALSAQDAGDFVVDGEVVAFEGNVSSFSRLQQRMSTHDPDEARRSPVAVYFYVFDLLHVDGYDITPLPLRRRKALLQRVLRFCDPVRFTSHRNREGDAYHRLACEKGWEGVIAKDAGSVYEHRRSTRWLKFKCVKGQELVIGGFTDPRGSRHGFGALLAGYHRDGALVYAGKIGTGFDDETLRDLGDRLRAREQETPPFDRGRLPRRGVHWVRPDLVCEAGFTEWTTDGRLRHPRYLGLRRDKDPAEVVREDGKD